MAFFVIHHETREIVLARVTAFPNSQWLAQQILEACGLSITPPRSLIYDRDSTSSTDVRAIGNQANANARKSAEGQCHHRNLGLVFGGGPLSSFLT